MKRNKSIKDIMAILLIFTLIFLGGCGNGANSISTDSSADNHDYSKPIPIGYNYEKSGMTASMGHQFQLGARLAVEAVEEEFGVKIKLIEKDNATDPQKAAQITRELADQDNVFAIVGPANSTNAKTAFPVANSLKVPIFNNGSLMPGLTEENRPWTFRNTIVGVKPIQEGAEAFIRHYNAAKFIILYDSKDLYTRTYGEETLPQAINKSGGEVVGTVTFTRGTLDFSTHISKLKELAKNTGAEAIALGGLTPEDVAIAKELERQNVGLPVFANLSALLDPVIRQTNNAVEGWLGTASFVPDIDKLNPYAKQFVQKYNDANDFDEDLPSSSAVDVYDCIRIIGYIIKEQGITADTPLKEAREKIRDGLQKLKDFQGVVGLISMTDKGETDKQSTIALVKNGKLTIYSD